MLKHSLRKTFSKFHSHSFPPECWQWLIPLPPINTSSWNQQVTLLPPVASQWPGAIQPCSREHWGPPRHLPGLSLAPAVASSSLQLGHCLGENGAKHCPKTGSLPSPPRHTSALPPTLPLLCPPPAPSFLLSFLSLSGTAGLPGDFLPTLHAATTTPAHLPQ